MPQSLFYEWNRDTILVNKSRRDGIWRMNSNCITTCGREWKVDIFAYFYNRAKCIIDTKEDYDNEIKVIERQNQRYTDAEWRAYIETEEAKDREVRSANKANAVAREKYREKKDERNRWLVNASYDITQHVFGDDEAQWEADLAQARERYNKQNREAHNETIPDTSTEDEQ